MKKLISCCLAIVSLLSLVFPASALTPAVSCSSSYQNSVYYQRLKAVNVPENNERELFSQIAISQLGYHEGRSSGDLSGESTGSGNYTEYGRYMCNYGSWCATFVSWCAAQAGLSSSVIKQGVYAGPMCSDTRTANEVLGGSYLPRQGDTVSFLWKEHYSRYTYSHVGIVRSVTLNPGNGSFTLVTIEGNVDDSVTEKVRTVYANGKLKSGNTEYGRVVNFGVPAFAEPVEGGPSKKPTITVSGQTVPGTLRAGASFGIRGIVTTDCGTLTEIHGEIVNNAGNAIQHGTYTPNSSSHDLRYSINNDLIFNELSPGNYTYRVLATAKNGFAVTVEDVIRVNFTVEGSADRQPVLSISGQNVPGSLRRGSSFGIRGIVTTDCGRITYVLGEIIDAWGNQVQYGAYTPNSTSHNLRYSINNDLVFNRLPAGSYTYRVTVTAKNGSESVTRVLVEQGFSVR